MAWLGSVRLCLLFGEPEPRCTLRCAIWHTPGQPPLHVWACSRDPSSSTAYRPRSAWKAMARP
eukprot:scaffold31557_cov66-Phaeocystis_antarctica.AAC.2